MTVSPEVSDTRRRAEIRGRESVARWRIESGVWSGRLFAVIYAVIAISPFLSEGGEATLWKTCIALLIVSSGILLGAQQMKKGSRLAACLLLALFIAAKIADWRLTGKPLWSGAFWTVILGGGLANGVWGTFALASAHRDAASIPPAPVRADRQKLGDA